MDRDRRNLIVGGTVVGAIAVGGLLPGMCVRKSERAGRAPPKRPTGKAKPMLEEDIAPVLARLDAWYAAHLKRQEYRFNPPAKEAELDAFERLVGFKMPGSWRQLYRWHDGENDDRWGHFYGLPLLPVGWAADQWKAWARVLSYFKGDRYQIPGGSWPQGAIDPAYINPRWIPLTHDGSGNHIGLDFDPWPNGRMGQVIIYGRDEEVKAVIAESLGKFLEWMADLLEGGNFRLEARPEELVLRQFRLKTPPSDSFTDGARIILGAPGPFG